MFEKWSRKYAVRMPSEKTFQVSCFRNRFWHHLGSRVHAEHFPQHFLDDHFLEQLLDRFLEVLEASSSWGM